MQRSACARRRTQECKDPGLFPRAPTRVAVLEGCSAKAFSPWPVIGQDGGWVRASIGAEAKASLCISQGRVLRTLVDYQSPTQVRAHSLPEGSRGRTSFILAVLRAERERKRTWRTYHLGHIKYYYCRNQAGVQLGFGYRLIPDSCLYCRRTLAEITKKAGTFFWQTKTYFSSIFLICSEWRAVCVNYSSCLTLHFLLQDYSKEQRERWLISGWRSPSRRKMNEAKRSSLSTESTSSSHR